MRTVKSLEEWGESDDEALVIDTGTKKTKKKVIFSCVIFIIVKEVTSIISEVGKTCLLQSLFVLYYYCLCVKYFILFKVTNSLLFFQTKI